MKLRFILKNAIVEDSQGNIEKKTFCTGKIIISQIGNKEKEQK